LCTVSYGTSVGPDGGVNGVTEILFRSGHTFLYSGLVFLRSPVSVEMIYFVEAAASLIIKFYFGFVRNVQTAKYSFLLVLPSIDFTSKLPSFC
jgi:hypothetical protein